MLVIYRTSSPCPRFGPNPSLGQGSNTISSHVRLDAAVRCPSYLLNRHMTALETGAGTAVFKVNLSGVLTGLLYIQGDQLMLKDSV